MSIKNNAMILGENLKHLRVRDKLTALEMAKIMRIGVATYKLLEQGTVPKRVTVDCLLYAADYFKLAPANLFKAQEEKHCTPITPPTGA